MQGMVEVRRWLEDTGLASCICPEHVSGLSPDTELSDDVSRAVIPSRPTRRSGRFQELLEPTTWQPGDTGPLSPGMTEDTSGPLLRPEPETLAGLSSMMEAETLQRPAPEPEWCERGPGGDLREGCRMEMASCSVLTPSTP